MCKMNPFFKHNSEIGMQFLSFLNNELFADILSEEQINALMPLAGKNFLKRAYARLFTELYRERNSYIQAARERSASTPFAVAAPVTARTVQVAETFSHAGGFDAEFAAGEPCADRLYISSAGNDIGGILWSVDDPLCEYLQLYERAGNKKVDKNRKSRVDNKKVDAAFAGSQRTLFYFGSKYPLKHGEKNRKHCLSLAEYSAFLCAYITSSVSKEWQDTGCLRSKALFNNAGIGDSAGAGGISFATNRDLRQSLFVFVKALRNTLVAEQAAVAAAYLNFVAETTTFCCGKSLHEEEANLLTADAELNLQRRFVPSATIKCGTTVELTGKSAALDKHSYNFIADKLFKFKKALTAWEKINAIVLLWLQIMTVRE